MIATVLSISGVMGNNQVFDMPADDVFPINIDDGYTDITVEEAWILLSNTSNGIQIPIDVRTDGEWKNEHIDTPPPENPRHYYLEDLKNENKLQDFILLYSDKEIILYCASGGRSATAANILADNEFTGTIYNMLGGITAWKAAGYPTIGNRPPDTPTITGPTSGKAETEYEYNFTATDPDGDDVYYYIDWGDETFSDWFGSFPSGKAIADLHIWDEQGSYNISVKAKDIYGAESEWSDPLSISMPKNKIISNSLFQWFLERFPLLARLLQLPVFNKLLKL